MKVIRYQCSGDDQVKHWLTMHHPLPHSNLSAAGMTLAGVLLFVTTNKGKKQDRILQSL
jgi:hypothetical protein